MKRNFKDTPTSEEKPVKVVEPPPKNFMERIDRLDKKISLFWHNLEWSVFQILLLPYAVIHNPPGIFFLWLLFGFYLCP